MSQTIAFVLPLPVVLALVLLLLGFLALTAVLLALRQPAPIQLPMGARGQSPTEGGGLVEEPEVRLSRPRVEQGLFSPGLMDELSSAGK